VQYRIPESVQEAISLAASALQSGRKAKFVAGGTDLVVQISESALQPEMLIDISSVQALGGIERDGSALRIGAATTLAEIAANGALPRCLVQGAGSIGSPQVRHLGTIGGNICNASPCADTLAPIIVLGGRFALRSSRGARELAAEEFFLGPKVTVLEADEILEEILLPCSSLEGRSAFRMIGKRNGQAISQVNIAVWIAPRSAQAPSTKVPIEEIRIAAGAVAPVPLRLTEAEAVLRGRVPSRELREEAKQAVRRQIRPISDVRTTEEYRRSVSASLFADALEEALAVGGGDDAARV
jgi:CO/xanthine dehydrogenase FAD-binding subunit